MQIRKNAYIHSLLALMIAPMVGCGGSGSISPSIVSTTGPTGKVLQGPVSGATIWADNISAGTRFVIDTAEQSTQTTTSSTGAYTLPVTPTYKYVIVSQGGTDTATNEKADTLLAPAGAQTVSPLTTLVALDTTGTLASTLNSILPAGTTFDSDLTANAALTPAAMVFLTSITTAVTTFDQAIQDAATKSSSTLTSQQLNDINLTLFSQMATQFASQSAASLSNTANLATNLQAALSNAVTSVATNNTNITGLSASTISTSIADNSVASAADIVGNATNTPALSAVTASNVTGSGVAVTTTGTVTESTVLSSGTNTTILTSSITSTATSASTNVTAAATPGTYAPATIPVITNPAVIGYKLLINASGSSWSVSSFTVTFSDDMVATSSGGTNYAHSVLNPANYQFTPTGCAPASYASDVVTFTCSNLLPPGNFVVTLVSSSTTAGVWASATSQGLLVNTNKTFVLPTVTGSTGGSSLSLF